MTRNSDFEQLVTDFTAAERLAANQEQTGLDMTAEAVMEARAARAAALSQAAELTAQAQPATPKEMFSVNEAALCTGFLRIMRQDGYPGVRTFTRRSRDRNSIEEQVQGYPIGGVLVGRISFTEDALAVLCTDEKIRVGDSRGRLVGDLPYVADQHNVVQRAGVITGRVVKRVVEGKIIGGTDRDDSRSLAPRGYIREPSRIVNAFEHEPLVSVLRKIVEEEPRQESLALNTVRSAAVRPGEQARRRGWWRLGRPF